jgi:hypothetical protein
MPDQPQADQRQEKGGLKSRLITPEHASTELNHALAVILLFEHDLFGKPAPLFRIML